MRFLKLTMAVAGKDIRSEWRTKEALNASCAFAIVVLLLFSFAFDPSSESTKEFAGGLLWLVFMFAGALIVNRSFVRELPNDCLDVLIASPLPIASLFLGKAIACFLMLLFIECVSLPVFGIFYNITWWNQPGWLFLVLALTTWAMSVVGTLFSALTVNLRLRELMLPMLLYPMLIPALMAAIQLTTVVLSNEPLAGDNFTWLKLLVGFDIIFTSLSLALVDFVLVR